MTTRAAPLCAYCAYLDRSPEATIFACQAYPAGIPEKYADGSSQHLSPQPDDGGKQYVPDEPLIESIRRTIKDPAWDPVDATDFGAKNSRIEDLIKGDSLEELKAAKPKPRTITRRDLEEAAADWDELVGTRFRGLLDAEQG